MKISISKVRDEKKRERIEIIVRRINREIKHEAKKQ
jgi:hypothetical protein